MSRTERVIEAISAMVRDGRLQPGDRLPTEAELSAELGISRTPLREGIRALSLLGVLESRQGDGTYVTDLDADSLFRPLQLASDIASRTKPLDVLAARRVLEVEAAGLAARTLQADLLAPAWQALAAASEVLETTPIDHEAMMVHDLAFHRAIAQASGNEVIAALLDALGSRTMRTRLAREQAETGVSSRTHAEHLAIMRAIEDREPERARAAMAVHLYAVESYVRDAHYTYPGGQYHA